MRKFFTYFATLLILFGLFGFFFNMFLSQNSVYNSELPLNSIQGIIEQNGNIYVGLGQYNRIQVYDLNGKFLHFINTSNHTKDYNFKIDEQGNPIINVIYLRKKPIKNYIQNDGSQYFIGNRIPLIIEKKDHLGIHHIIKQPFHMSLWSGVWNPWLIAIFGIFLFFTINSVIMADLDSQNISKKEHMKQFFKRIFI
jgi:hypothetical protein